MTQPTITERVERIAEATKLWQGLDGQKQWLQNNPRLCAICDGAIVSIRLEIILLAQTPSQAVPESAQPDAGSSRRDNNLSLKDGQASKR